MPVQEIDEINYDELRNALKIAYVDANASTIFTNNNNQSQDHLIYQVNPNEGALTGAARLINNHKKNGGNK